MSAANKMISVAVTCRLQRFLIWVIFLLLDSGRKMADLDIGISLACGLVLELKPPNMQRFEVSHLLLLIVPYYSEERPFTPAWTRRKTGNGMHIVRSQS